jgi:hypothetical protein
MCLGHKFKLSFKRLYFFYKSDFKELIHQFPSCHINEMTLHAYNIIFHVNMTQQVDLGGKSSDV